MNALKIENKKLNGEILVPPSKSDAHRAIICASLSKEKSEIYNVDISKDILSTIEGMRKLGAEINILEDNKYNKLEITGFKNSYENSEITCRESGSTLRFLIPLAIVINNGGTFTGEGKLIERPLGVYYEIFHKIGIKYENRDGMLPLNLKGNLIAGEYSLRGDVSSQFITGLMFALPLIEGDSVIKVTTELQSKGYVDLTIKVLKEFGVEVINREYREFIIKGNQKYLGRKYFVEGDYSQSAFWIAGGILGKKIRIKSLNKDSVQGDKIIKEIVEEMKGNIKNIEEDLIVEESETRGTTIDVSECPDLAPILTVLGAVSKGTTRIINGERLRMKESDRLTSITTELKKLGANIEEGYDNLTIEGVKSLNGGVVDSWNDHRIAMALAIASAKCKEPIILTGWKSVEKSYPKFWEDYGELGGTAYEWKLGEEL
ncbi:3-phosphoshikimate 1-carboxyvinyltransferase [Oceanirhabdus sp. W0125-5]|uniref:3-phosphoshikimate 1-carboxyvinyltransferase n=1 Tax=Oceanirhabdus sp. W0125-5 TaxID=2999116 RepID=UPI0022F2C577|nr:3-phosphoshikimate 1-carboxyvinyltransferase [Oceanirhabdus sp. W0125-5]WBW99350.1 3-phosphoshikimate 1-carboxyvinyltransferase [Oceanirhabdus sp. W0125-5]